MNPSTVQEAVDLARAVRDVRHDGVDLGVAPPAIFLDRVAEALRGSDVVVYAQDAHWEDRGAFTGQISAAMLRGVADGSIVGHSEVRRDQGDDDARVSAKAWAALQAGLRVIFCLGESLEQRQRGETGEMLERQVRTGLGTIDKDLLIADDRSSRLAIAYEPVWAIGTGVAATGAQVRDAIDRIRLELRRLGIDGTAMTILYGGSVSAATVGEFARAEGVDGALVGGASLKPEEFAAIVAAFR